MKSVLEFTTEALVFHQQKTKEVESYYREGGPFNELKDWGAKFIGQTVRMAGLLHAATHPTSFKNQPISLDTIQRAYKIGEYLIPHAQKAYGLVSNNPEIEMAKRVLEWIKKDERVSFTQNECHSRFKNTLATADQVSKVLQVLAERNYIREVQREGPRGAGRPSRLFQVNPEAL